MNDQNGEDQENTATEPQETPVSETDQTPTADEGEKPKPNWIPGKFKGMQRTGTKFDFRKPSNVKKKRKKNKPR